MLKRVREPFNGLTHLFAAAASAIGLAVLLITVRSDTTKWLSLLVYGSSLVLMFSSSAAYHLIKAGSRLDRFLRQLDHAAIYLLIAGTYTPICIHFFTGFWQWGVLGVIWLLALIGITAKVFTINAPRWLTAGIYLLMGWLSIMAIKEILFGMPMSAVVWLILGGLAFTIGAVVYITRWPEIIPGVFGFHELWHIFVILGCLSHFILIIAYVAPF